MTVVNPGLEVRSRGNAVLLNPPTIAPKCDGILIIKNANVMLYSETFLSYSFSFSGLAAHY
jgi:hypothetical protein